jgi:hypothetical protein
MLQRDFSRQTMLKLTKISVSWRSVLCNLIIKAYEFLIWCFDCLTQGQSKPAKNFANPCIGEPMQFTISHSGRANIIFVYLQVEQVHVVWASPSIETGHNIDFSSTSILVKATVYVNHVIDEAVEIKLHPSNFNKDFDFTLSWSWYPVTNMLKQYRGTLIWKQGQAKQALDFTHYLPSGSCSDLSKVSWGCICGTVRTHSHIIALLMGTDMVPEILVVFNKLTWLIAQEDFINISRHESIMSYIILDHVLICQDLFHLIVCLSIRSPFMNFMMW